MLLDTHLTTEVCILPRKGSNTLLQYVPTTVCERENPIRCSTNRAMCNINKNRLYPRLLRLRNDITRQLNYLTFDWNATTNVLDRY